MPAIHTISSGETLSSIVRRYNSTVDAIAKANNIQNPNLIIAGRQLTIPDGFDAQPRPSSDPQAGDGFDARLAPAAPPTRRHGSEIPHWRWPKRGERLLA